MAAITIEIPSGIQIEIKDSRITTKGSLGSNTRRFNDALLNVAVEKGKLLIKPVEHKQLVKKAGMASIAFAKQVKNDIEGVGAYYERSMQVVFAHFPITVEVSGDKVLIKNIIGERAARVAAIAGATKVEIKGANLRIYGTNINDVSQTCANLRKACRIRRKDTRVFQDGVYFSLE
jgi:large subunit ribosomal protein L6